MLYTRNVTDTPEFFNFSSNACCGVKVERVKKVCYLTETPAQNSIVFDASSLTIDKIENIELYKQQPIFLFAEGFYLNVSQQSLSKSAFEYWRQVGLLSSPEGNVFQEPVGRLVTNFKNLDDESQEIFGFFYATEERIIREYVDPELAGFPSPSCPPPPVMRGCPDPLCCNCASVENSTTTKPEWWEY